MAEIVKTVRPSLATKLPCDAHRTHGSMVVGDTGVDANGYSIHAGDACYIKSDGTVWRSSGAAATAPAKVDGFATDDYAPGEVITLYHDVEFAYGPKTMVPGTRLFLSGTVLGGLADAASTGGTGAIGVVQYLAPNEGTPSAVIFLSRSTY